MRVAAIGGDTSGLVTLKYLKTAHHFFPGKAVGAVLRAASLVSSKFLTAFSGFRAHESDSDFLSAERCVRYLVEVRRRLDGGHIVHYRKANDNNAGVLTYECDTVAVCTGLRVTPNVPNIPGIQNVPVIKHSSEFKRREAFGREKAVVILGSEETGIDLAHPAVTLPTKCVILSHRDEFLDVPKANPNRREVPVDVSWHAPLFDSMYLHPLIRDTLFTWNVYDWGVKATSWLLSGMVAGLDRRVGSLPKERYHVSKLFNKGAPKALPYTGAPYRPTDPGVVERICRSILQAPLEILPYAYQLALDTGSTPGFCDAVHAGWSASWYQAGLWWRIPVIWVAGA
ncbi:hypothetical protein AAE478_008171 [Parahypoxylon ruwenzoriense]